MAVSDGTTSLLVDLGLSCRAICSAAKACAFDPGRASGVLFTHDHSDHCKGAATFRKKFPHVPFYANGATADAISACTGAEDGWKVFETATRFAIGGFTVEPFPVPHDAADATGYLLSSGGRSLFVATDLGCATAQVRDALSRADCAVLESNHDRALLLASQRAWPLKQRILGRSGHLSNDDAAELLRECASTRLKTVLLAHLSEECNSPHLALEAARNALGDAGCAETAIDILPRGEPSRLYLI